ncbi:dienelactone hydrolase family protein, partial [Sedimenticola sp.]|uniref:dienelactone hydrolase family protein n=1 Tax=Sedimenticola sp. TaxID=1940285 RepID=UPI003D0A8675
GILVLHPWWGLNDTIKKVCDRLANEGYIACAPDLYHGEIAVTIEEAEELSDKLDDDQARTDIADALKVLDEQLGAEGQKIGVIGFSLGAYYALELSANDPDRVGAVVLFYGTGPGDFSQAQAAYQGHFAAVDEYEPDENVAWLENALKASGNPVTFYRYEGVGHWFFEPDRPDAYNQSAAQLAWERTVSFLKNTMV